MIRLSLMLVTLLTATGLHAANDPGQPTDVPNAEENLFNYDEFSTDEMTDESATDVACWRFDGYPRRCIANGCNYNTITNRCVAGGGNARPWACLAFDTGFEEHRQGHQGRGWSRAEAARDARAMCGRNHGRCEVRNCWQY